MLDFIIESVTKGTPTLGSLILCTVCSLAFGFAIAAVYMFRNKYSKTLAVTLVLLPAIVQVIIMLVNGNIGVGIAVAGAFSLVRFRSIAGNSKNIGYLFFAMAIGFVTGMGYLFYALIFLLLIGGVGLLLTQTRFGQSDTDIRVLKITIPENLDYDGVFDEVFEKYTLNAELERVKTTNMGSLFELTYQIRMKSEAMPKEFIDELRCRNGNLNVIIGREQRNYEEL